MGKLQGALQGSLPLYMLPGDPIAEQVLIPGFRSASRVDCMAGFFSSQVLASLAPGLATYISKTDNSLRMIISPLLSAKDQAAIVEGTKHASDAVDDFFDTLIVTENQLQQHTLKCLSWLLRNGRIEIKIALMKDALFHPKVWMFYDELDAVAVHGSSNITYSGITKNIEQLSVSKSWIDQTQRFTADKLTDQFVCLWNNKHDNCKVFDLPEAVRRNILRNYPTDAPPAELEQYDEIAATSAADDFAQTKPPFAVPEHLRYDTGDFAHQGKAVEAWCAAEFRGILEMATGSGKTIASMIGAYRLYSKCKPLLIVIAAPYRPLMEQWCDEVRQFGVEPVNLASYAGPKARAKALQELHRSIRLGSTDIEVVICSHDILCDEDFIRRIAGFTCARLLIADEVHNLGRPTFIQSPPEIFEYRLGLSATPVRQYDEEGTARLIEFFGTVAFKFTLEEAIGNCLVEYDYHLHYVELTSDEMDTWHELTAKLRKNSWREDNNDPSEYQAKLLRDRRAVLETAANKITVLSGLLEQEDMASMRHALVYTTDKAPGQLEDVNRLLHQKNIRFHQLTAEETKDRKKTQRIITSFQEGAIQALTAKRVLDEGVNIPQVCKAYLLASTTVERQWVQRRGRLLRKCNETNKTHSVIHDLLVLPSLSSDDDEYYSVVKSELRRAREFAKLARNATSSLVAIDDIMGW